MQLSYYLQNNLPALAQPEACLPSHLIFNMKFSRITTTLRKWLTVLLTLIIAIALSGCNPTEFRTTAAQVPQVVVSVIQDPDTFNYALGHQLPNIFGLTFKG